MQNASHRGAGRILIMDDEDFIIDVLGQMLCTMGYTVASARDGKDALNLFFEAKDSKEPFKAAIFDLTIPGGKGGKEAIAELRKKDTGTAVIVSSGYSEDPIMSDPSAFGFNDSLSKPFIEGDVVALFNRLFPEAD
jgi:CheY-like chemotaxis protein